MSNLEAKEAKKIARQQTKDARTRMIQNKLTKRRTEYCIWEVTDGSDSCCSLVPLDAAMRERTGNSIERTECYGSPTACRYKALYTPQGDYSTEPMEIVDWFTKYRYPKWLKTMANFYDAGAEKVYVMMTRHYFSFRVIITLPRDYNKAVGLMIEIINLQPDICISTLNQTEAHRATVDITFYSPDEKRHLASR